MYEKNENVNKYFLKCLEKNILIEKKVPNRNSRAKEYNN